MSFFLFADTEPARGLVPFLKEYGLILVPCALAFIGIYLLLPRAKRIKPISGGALTAAAFILGATTLVRGGTSTLETMLFLAFAGVAIAAGVMMITQSNPVHAALSFALVVLSTCGLFLLQAAPFLMAATIIGYAGAIVVTFHFVIMLAQQEAKARTLPFVEQLKKTHPDNQTLQDSLGQITLSWVQLNREDKQSVEELKKNSKKALAELSSLQSKQGSLNLNDVPGKAKTPGHFPPGKLPAKNVAAIGKTLFTDYLIPVELAATLLLVATIGAIVIAGRRSEELR